MTKIQQVARMEGNGVEDGREATQYGILYINCSRVPLRFTQATGKPLTDKLA